MYTEYGIVYADSIEKLTEEVNKLLKDGWTLYGQIGIDVNASGERVFFHEMVIEKKN
jgi:hypothetical protein